MKTKIPLTLSVALLLLACSFAGVVTPAVAVPDMPDIGLTLPVATEPPAPGPGTTTTVAGSNQYLVIALIVLAVVVVVVVAAMAMSRRQS
jgi:hypothetical protein